jgi:DNA-binding beta-propeller fold protein YncE
MFAWDPKRIIIGVTICIYSIFAISGCSGGSGGNLPFSDLTSGDGVGASAKFNGPTAITTDGTNLYVADANNDTIRQIVIATGVVTTIAGSPGVPGTTDGTGFGALFNSPHGITIYNGNLFVTDTASNLIRQVAIATGAVTTIAGLGSTPPLDSPEGIATDGINLYIANKNGQTIQEVLLANDTMSVLAGTTGTSGAANGNLSTALFDTPGGVAVATINGTYVYVADTGNNSIRMIATASGEVTTLAGTGAIGANDGAGDQATFNSPSGLTTDGVNVYVADTGNDTIRAIDITTGVVSTLAGTPGEIGSANGTGINNAQFSSPLGLTVSGPNLYVADTNNNTIRQIVIATGAVTTLAGTPP